MARSKAWAEYQRAAAEFFDSLGLAAEVEASVKGVRSAHVVDVLVTFSAFGIDQCWVVECKHWKRRVKKEQVMTLRSIVDDLGADRGFLLSESGFQSGAITASRLSNITLTSLEDLRENAEADLQALRWETVYRRVADGEAKLRQLTVTNVFPGGGSSRIKHGVDGDEYLRSVADLATLVDGLQRAKTGRFPAPYGFTEDGARLVAADSMPEFLEAAERRLDELERWIDDQIAKPWS